jgi:carbon storage regulator CsrA
MLVLTRRLNEKIVLPDISTTIEVVAIKPGAVRLGVVAPLEVAVLRDELLDRSGTGPPPPRARVDEARERQLKHLLRNRLNAATVGLALARRQLQLGLSRETEVTLDTIRAEIASLQEQLLDGGTPPPPLTVPVRPAEVVEDERAP